MSFKENTYQKMSYTDSFSGLTAREQKALKKHYLNPDDLKQEKNIGDMLPIWRNLLEPMVRLQQSTMNVRKSGGI